MDQKDGPFVIKEKLWIIELNKLSWTKDQN